MTCPACPPPALFEAADEPLDPDVAVVAHADNLEFLGGLGDGAVDLVVTSPPYALDKEYEQAVPREESLALSLAHQEQVIGEAVRVVAPTGSICWQTGNTVDDGEVIPIDSLLYAAFKTRGLQMRGRIVWHFGHGLHCSRRLSGRYEVVCWWTKTGDYKWNLDPIRVPSKYPAKRHFKGPNAGALSGNPLGKNPSDVWDIPNVKHNHPEKTDHPCQFPVELAERLILALTDPGDTVLDPYAGSGTAVAAAVLHGRRGLGCDNVAAYVDIARRRVRLAAAGALPRRPPGPPAGPARPRPGAEQPPIPLPADASDR